MSYSSYPESMEKSSGVSRLEFFMVILTGVAHVGLELWADGMRGAADTLGRPQHVFNALACVAWGCYVVFKIFKHRELLQEWGFRRGGFIGTLCDSLVFVVPALLAMCLLGRMTGRPLFPRTLFVLILVYPAWGIAQQFALQVFITRNVGFFVEGPFRLSAVSAIIFSLAHFPNIELMPLTFIAGLFFTWLYLRRRNLWAVGCLHGLLGAIAYYHVLGLDPGAELLGKVGL